MGRKPLSPQPRRRGPVIFFLKHLTAMVRAYAHHRDPLAEINLTEDDFDWATGRLMECAGSYSNNRLVSLLEGGYDLQGLSDSVSAHVSRLMRG